ncbi:pimeloyl-ACP methyl ester carboxylesterase [Caldalkalibacillus uzonensis]|uniref:Pimeloyl-ACP methyl ester carboxylesterase n=1 Tax=Caldalkalibacillus uzonensis TaxID=353224 RepID=A0ABU0CYC7_9BACI|nr:alpha/beta hydrolase [Caldalkalibacillus uzonensis]MDQ0341144.1 pimeloyl-ACP methyl ester carboxylesterase [Caldalkalibacillus uzonensis]
MGKWLSMFIDKMGLFLLHRKRSLYPQFHDDYALDTAVEKQASFFKLDTLPDLTLSSGVKLGSTGRFTFESPVQSGDQENDTASGIYYLSDRSKAKQISSPAHVIIIHGWRSDHLDKFKKIYLNPMLKEGYHVYFPTLPYHFERTVGGLYSGEYMISANVGRTVTAVRQAVLEIRTLIQWLRQNIGGQVVLIGVSLGGYVANLTSLYEQEIDALVSVMYVNDLAYAIWHTPVGKYIKRDFEQHGYTYEHLCRKWSILRTDCQSPLLPKKRILLISGKHDQYVMNEDAERLWLAWGKPRRLVYRCGHAGIIFNRKQIARDTLHFLESALGNGQFS